VTEKKLPRSPDAKRPLVEADNADLTVRRQCQRLGLARSSRYYQSAGETAENLRLMRLIDQEYTAYPFSGSRKLTRWLVQQGEAVNRKRVQRLMRWMGLEAIYPKPRLSAAGRGHRIYPYLLREVSIERPGQVWSTDITYIATREGWLYLAAVEDLYSRQIVGGSMSERITSRLVVDALEMAV
jgi:putative transposase